MVRKLYVTNRWAHNVIYRHQETALHFMWQREFGPIPPEFSLWSYECNIMTPMCVFSMSSWDGWLTQIVGT